MLELRILDGGGDLAPTANELEIPPLEGVVTWDVSEIILADVCFNDSDGTYLKWKRNLSSEDVAIAIYNRRGRLETLYVCGKRIGDEELIWIYLKRLSKFPLTCYNCVEGRSLTLFLVPYSKRHQFVKENNENNTGRRAVANDIEYNGKYVR